MKKQIFKSLFLAVLLCFIGFNSGFAQTASCCSKAKDTSTAACNTKEASAKTACCASAPKETTSGCTPSNCRGAKTKFGEAKVISDLREKLYALKADMEKSEKVKFPERSFSVHGIIGETDIESLNIIASEVKIIESAFEGAEFELEKTNFDADFSNAKKVSYLSDRITYLNSSL